MTVAWRHGHRWMAWLGLGLLIAEVLVVGLVGELSMLIALLSIDGAGALIGLLFVKLRRGRKNRGEQRSGRSSLQEGAESSRSFLENSESRPKVTGLNQRHEASQMRVDWRTTSGMRLEKEGVKWPNDDTKAYELLYQAGFTATESNRLCLLRRRYVAREEVGAGADMCRLKFVRWLVETGKLTDQL